MADPKKPAKPASSSSGGGNEWVFGLMVVVLVLFVIFPTVAMFFGYSGDVNVITPGIGDRISYAFSSFLESVSFVSIFISFVLVLGILYAKMGHKEIVVAHESHVANSESLMQRPKGAQGFGAAAQQGSSQSFGLPGLPGQHSAGGHSPAQEKYANPKWEQVERHASSPNQSEWRIAILEADILLYDMLSQMGYPGDSIGEMLKQADKSSFTTLDEAWKAHRIRNIIAHEGADYILTKEEADRAIRLYKKVFDEFYFI